VGRLEKNPPAELKLSPIAMIPHKSKLYRAMFDLSYRLRLSPEEVMQSVNKSTKKTAPRGAIDQLGHSLPWIIHALSEVDDNVKVFMKKWDIKDGFWRLNCEEGEDFNFAYALPQEEGMPIKLVIPTALQMGWIESPPYFGTAYETGRDVAEQYVEQPVGILRGHKFAVHVAQGEEFESMPETSNDGSLRYLLEVFVDDYISLAIPTLQEHMVYIGNTVMRGIHDFFEKAEETGGHVGIEEGDLRFRVRRGEQDDVAHLGQTGCALADLEEMSVFITEDEHCHPPRRF
jgi:hypothetical protein